MNRAGVPYRITLTDWSRALNSAMRQSNACVYSTARLPEREKSFQWLGPVAQTGWYLWGLDGGAKVTSLEGVRGKIICAKVNDAPGRFLTSLGQNVVPAQTGEVCARHVLRGEAAYWAANMYQSKLILAQIGLQDNLVPALEFQRMDVFPACNLAMPKGRIEKLRIALQTGAEAQK